MIMPPKEQAEDHKHRAAKRCGRSLETPLLLQTRRFRLSIYFPHIPAVRREGKEQRSPLSGL